MRKPNSPAPTRFQNATATKKKIGQRYAATHGRARLEGEVLIALEADQHQRHNLQCAEGCADSASTAVGVPLK